MTLSKAGELHGRGFTLIELLVVCGILAATAYVAWGGYFSAQSSAEDDIARAEMLRLADGLKRFKADTGYWPGQGPFILSPPGTAESATGDGFNCSAPGGAAFGVLRSWVANGVADSDRDIWFASPANLALLFTQPSLCANHPLHFLAVWNADSGRGWHGPYLDLASRKWVDIGVDFNANAANATGPYAGAPYGNGSPIAGSKIIDVPAFGAGRRLPAAGPSWSKCSEQEMTTGNCLLGWRSLPRASLGYDAGRHELTAHPRPFAVFGLADNDHPRIVYFGRDGRYGGRHSVDPCLPNAVADDGEDDVVLCLGQ